MMIADDLAPQLRTLPGGPGAFVFFDAQDRPVLLAVAQNLQSLITRRLLPPPPEDGKKPKTDVRAITRSLAIARAGSMFEAEWLWLHLARTMQPDVYDATLDRWRCWYVHGHPAHEFPRFVRTQHPERPPAGDDGTCIGPFPDRAAAGRFIEALEDAFDLCRYHHVLVQAPDGVACAYKEMGRCPAPCDGSVSMDAYRESFAQALRFAASDGMEHQRDLERRMQQAAANQAYERAQELHRQLQTCASVRPGAAVHARDLAAFRWLVIAPSERPGWIRLFVSVVDDAWPLLDVRTAIDEDAITEIVHLARARATQPQRPPNVRTMANVTLVARHLFKAQRADEPEVTFIRIDDRNGAEAVDAVCRAIRTRVHAVAPNDSAPADAEGREAAQ
jgi:excinuclease UvrABC nuclease subunit